LFSFYWESRAEYIPTKHFTVCIQLKLFKVTFTYANFSLKASSIKLQDYSSITRSIVTKLISHLTVVIVNGWFHFVAVTLINFYRRKKREPDLVLSCER
jgi:hypothetical protein